jgi:hypothetical protein
MVARAGGYACTDPSRSDFLLVRVIFFSPPASLFYYFFLSASSGAPQTILIVRNITCSPSWGLSPPLSRTGVSLSRPLSRTGGCLSRPLSVTCSPSCRLSLGLCLELSPVSVRSLQTNTKPLCCRHGGLVSLSVLQHRGLVRSVCL